MAKFLVQLGVFASVLYTLLALDIDPVEQLVKLLPISEVGVAQRLLLALRQPAAVVRRARRVVRLAVWPVRRSCSQLPQRQGSAADGAGHAMWREKPCACTLVMHGPPSPVASTLRSARASWPWRHYRPFSDAAFRFPFVATPRRPARTGPAVP